MLFGNQHEQLGWVHLISLLGILTSIIGLALIALQLRTHRLLLRLHTSGTRHSMFIYLSDCLTDDARATMRTHLIDHIRPDIFHDRYKDNKEALDSYLIMKRKYLYIIFSLRLERNFPLNEKGIAAVWLKELARYKEFRDVHESQEHYYKQFAPEITEAIKDATPKGWMYQAHLHQPEVEPQIRTDEKAGTTPGGAPPAGTTRTGTPT